MLVTLGTLMLVLIVICDFNIRFFFWAHPKKLGWKFRTTHRFQLASYKPPTSAWCLMIKVGWCWLGDCFFFFFEYILEPRFVRQHLVTFWMFRQTHKLVYFHIGQAWVTPGDFFKPERLPLEAGFMIYKHGWSSNVRWEMFQRFGVNIRQLLWFGRRQDSHPCRRRIHAVSHSRAWTSRLKDTFLHIDRSMAMGVSKLGYLIIPNTTIDHSFFDLFKVILMIVPPKKDHQVGMSLKLSRCLFCSKYHGNLLVLGSSGLKAEKMALQLVQKRP